jgi:hypothetical protein
MEESQKPRATVVTYKSKPDIVVMIDNASGSFQFASPEHLDAYATLLIDIQNKINGSDDESTEDIVLIEKE